MRRRHFVGAIPFLTVSPELLSQFLAGQAIPKLDATATDVVGAPVTRFFAAPQFAALRRLSDLVLPSIGGAPGALEAGVPEFLDFLVGQSLLPTKTLYRNGLQTLNLRATAKFAKTFSVLEDTQADAILSPLHQSWTYKEPADPFAVFLRHAKADILTATSNSREWVTAAQKNRGGGGGNGTYWLPAE